MTSPAESSRTPGLPTSPTSCSSGLLATPAGLAWLLSQGAWLPAPHLRILNRKLTDLATGRIRRLLVSMPPRHGKSELISHWLPVWYLNTWPHRRIILATYGAEFAADWGRRVRNTIQEHREALRVDIAQDSAAANRWHTTAGGGMIAAGAGGPITGRGADMFIIDDPVKTAEDAYSPTYRERVWEWWTTTARTRLEPGASVVLLMTRWHDDDLAGRVLRNARETGLEWEVLELPALAEARDPLGRQPGEALWPERYDVEELLAIQAQVGSRTWSALYQQSPLVEDGGYFQRGWWRYYLRAPVRLDEVLQSWDMAFKGTGSSDFVVGQVWGRSGADRYLLDQVRGRWDFPRTLEAVRSLSDRWPEARVRLVEDKANGPAVIDTLRRELQGLVPVEPQGGKVARAAAVSHQVEGGNVWLPARSIADDGTPVLDPWVRDFIEEAAAFPTGTHDDQVDAMTQALLRLGRGATMRFGKRPAGL